MAKTTTDQDRRVRVAAKPTLLKLVYSSGLLETPTVSLLADGERVIGREPPEPWHTTPILLPQDPRASRQHASLRSVDGRVIVTDHGSKHGTWVNGVLIESRQLSDGDLLRVGDSLLVFRDEVDRAAESRPAPRGFVAESSPMRTLLCFLDQLAARTEPVLLVGETGTGKEVLAKYLHERSQRSGPLLALNCATLSPDLADSELFGHQQGAFTGAKRSHDGFFRDAKAGTLFLDEVGELPLSVQSKLLRALAERKITPVGTTQELAYSARVIAATNRNLELELERGGFRADLLARLSAFRVELPPLRKRREDILPILLSQFTNRPAITCALAQALLLYRWPLNVRELINLATFLKTRYPDDALLDLPHVDSHISSSFSMGTVANRSVAAHDGADPAGSPPIARAALVQLLAKHDGVVARVAADVGRSPRQVRRWMASYHVERAECLPK